MLFEHNPQTFYTLVFYLELLNFALFPKGT